MTEPKSRERRGLPRKRTSIQATAKAGYGEQHDLEISDLSPTGCAIRASGHPLKAGATYGLKINGLEMLDSRAAWADGKLAGLAFDHALHPAVADHIADLNPPKVPPGPLADD